MGVLHTPSDCCRAGNAYIFVMMIMLTLFLLITSVLGLTASGRRISGHYVRFAGLYNLALAGNERAMLLLRDEVAYHTHAMSEEVRQKLHEGNIEEHLIYYNGEFLLEDRFIQLFREEKNRLAADFFANNLNRGFFECAFGNRLLLYYFSYNLTISTGTYHVRTAFEPYGSGYRVRTRANKAYDNRLMTDNLVYGVIEWPVFAHQARVVPTLYTWRDGPPYWMLNEYWKGPDPHTIFAAARYMNKEEQRNFFDYLGLTRFNEAQNEVTDIAWLLRYVRIAEFELDIDPLDGFAPRLIRTQHVAN